MPAVSTWISQRGPVNRSIEMLRIEMRLEDGESQWKSEREERKEETSRKSETVRLAIINHIRSWRPPRILATRQIPSASPPSLLHLAGAAWSLFSSPILQQTALSAVALLRFFFLRKQQQQDDFSLETASTFCVGTRRLALPPAPRPPPPWLLDTAARKKKNGTFQYSRRLARVYFILSLFHCKRSPHKSCLKL